jgi:hypothetical protein
MAPIRAVAILAALKTTLAFSLLPSSSYISNINLFNHDRRCLAYPEMRSKLHKASISELVCMSKKDQRYKLAKRPDDEDRLLLTVAEQFRRREGQAQISWYPGTSPSTPLVSPCLEQGVLTDISILIQQGILRPQRKGCTIFLVQLMLL